MNPFIVFDVIPENQLTRVVNELKKKGYHSAWLSNSIKYDLPSNCVWKPNSELEASYKDVQEAILSLNREPSPAPQIILSKCMVLSNTPWVGKSSDVTPP